MLTIEEKDGLTERPPHRQYKTPRHLLPELEKFITEMLQKGWIEPSTSEYSSGLAKPGFLVSFGFLVFWFNHGFIRISPQTLIKPNMGNARETAETVGNGCNDRRLAT